VKPRDSALAESDPTVAAAVRLMHRRRGWIWATVISVIAFVVACGLLGSLAPNASGAGVGVASVFILLLAVVTVVGLIASIVDTVRLHRLDPGVRAQAAPRTAHHPVRAHAYRYPPRHRWTWVFSWLVMAILLGLGGGDTARAGRRRRLSRGSGEHRDLHAPRPMARSAAAADARP
jgi:hypothetical protein